MSDADPYCDAMMERIGSGDLSEAATIARRAFADDTIEEYRLAWIAGVIYEREIDGAYDLISEFVHRYPESGHIIRVYLADLFARAGRFDEATEHARIHLRQALDVGVLDKLEGMRIIAAGVGRAFLLLTCVYTESGARSYSRRVLQFGHRHAVGDKWHDCYRTEIERLDDELQDPETRAIDDQWEAFFTSGQHADALFDQARAAGYERLAQRIDLIEGRHRFDSRYVPDETEFFQLVFESEESDRCLA